MCPIVSLVWQVFIGLSNKRCEEESALANRSIIRNVGWQPGPILEATMLTKLIAIGFTKDQGEKAITDLGIETENDLKHLTEKDLTDLGIKPIPARRILAAAGVTPVGSGPQEVTVRLDKGDKSVSEIDELEDLLAVIASATRSASDRKAAARKLSGMGRKVVVNKGSRKELRVDDTVAYWRRGSLTAWFWGRDNHPVVSAATLFESDEKVEIDPFELVNGRRLVALDSGYNAESGADWAKVTTLRRALLIAAALDGETVARGDSVAIAETLSSETLSGKWKVLESRADAERLTELQRHLCVPLIDIDTPDSAGASVIMVAVFGRQSSDGSSSGRGSGFGEPVGGTANRSKEFREYLMRGFDASGIRRINWDLRSSLPGDSASLVQTATAFVECAERQGLVRDPNFWGSIIAANTGRAREARAVAAMYGVTNL